MEIIISPGHWKDILLILTYAFCRPCFDVSKLFPSVYLNFETMFPDAG